MIQTICLQIKLDTEQSQKMLKRLMKQFDQQILKKPLRKLKLICLQSNLDYMKLFGKEVSLVK